MYFSLSLKDGEPIAKIKGKPFEQFKFVRIKRHDKEPEGEDNIREFLLPDKCELQPLSIRQENDMPNRTYVGGASLCGKSYLASKIAEDYNELFPDNRVVMFSAVEDDENFDKVKNFYRIDCDDIVDEPIELEDLRDTLCIFDDINAFADKDVIKEVNTLRDKIMSTGRHHNIDVVSTAQVTLDGKKSQQCILNNFCYVGFPKSGGRYHLKEYCKKYMALEKDQIDKVLNLPTRWVMLNRVPPQFCMHQKGVFLL